MENGLSYQIKKAGKKSLTIGKRYGNLTKLSARRRLVRPAGRSMKNVKKVEKVVDKMAGI